MRRRTGAGLLAAALAASLAGSAHADLNDDKATVEKKIEDSGEHFDDLSGDLGRAHAALTESRAKLPAAQNALAAAQAAADQADARNEQAKAELALARADEAKAADDLAATSASLDEQRSALAGFAAQLYTEQGTGTLAIALDAEDPQQLADRMSLSDVLMDVQAGVLSDLTTSQANLLASQDRLVALRERVAAAQQATEQALAQAQAAEQVAASAKAELDALVADQEAAAATLEAETAKEKRRLAALERQSDAITAKLAAIAEAERKAEAERRRKAREAAEAAQADADQGSGSTGGQGPTAPPTTPPDPPSGGGYFGAPSRGWISSEYGYRWHPILHYWKLHTGRDYAAPCGDPVYAAAPGTVVSAGWAGGYGNSVAVSHGIVGGAALATTYNHLSQIVVSSGSVARGQLVGYVGTTGMSTGCHLHFEARVNGVPQDPRQWL